MNFKRKNQKFRRVSLRECRCCVVDGTHFPKHRQMSASNRRRYQAANDAVRSDTQVQHRGFRYVNKSLSGIVVEW